MKKEIQLTGGRSTIGVVRQGDVVFRPHKTESDFANVFLQFLETQNFPYAQRYLGRDNNGRDKFQFIEGYVPNEIGYTTIEQLCRFMQIVRQFHDLSLYFTKSNKVICHNDLSPCNTIFKNNMPTAIIDWDSCAVGEQWEDLTYILWLWINIGSFNRNNIDIIGQMKTALASYKASKEITKNFTEKLIWRMDKVILEMPENNYQYRRTKDWVEFSKLWVKENNKIITKDIG